MGHIFIILNLILTGIRLVENFSDIYWFLKCNDIKLIKLRLRELNYEFI